MKDMRIRPQILAAMVGIVVLGAMVILHTPEHADKIVVAAITAELALGLKVLEGE